MSAHLILVM